MNRPRHRTRSFVSTVLSLALVLAMPISAPAWAPAADDDIPGVAIPASPFDDALDETTDPNDVFAVPLQAGESFTATLTGAVGTDFDIALFSPDATSVLGPTPPVAENPIASYPETFTYTVTTTGTYYFDVTVPISGAGTYTAEWATATAEPPIPPSDDNIPGATTLPASPAVGTLDDLTDSDDVYKVHLSPGQKIDATLSWSDPNPDAAFQLFLFDPTATDIETDVPVADSLPNEKPATISYIARVEGDFYLDVYALLGTGAYSLSYTITAAPAPDGNNDIPSAVTMPAAPVAGALTPGADDHDVYKIDLIQGQVLSVTLNAIGSPTPEFFADLYPPGSVSLSTALPVATANPDTFVYTAPVTGRYYLDVSTVDSIGTYQLIWSLSRFDTAIASSLATTVAWSKGAALAATLTAGSTALGGRTVRVEAKPYGALAFSKLTDLVTNGSGLATTTVYPTKRTEYRVVFDGDSNYSASTGATLTIIPYAYLTRPYTVRSVYAVNQRFTAYGSLKPRHPAGARSVRVTAARYERQSNGTYKWVTRRVFYPKNVNYNGYTRYTTSASLPSRGKWRLIARILGDTTHATTYSTPRYVTVK